MHHVISDIVADIAKYTNSNKNHARPPIAILRKIILLLEDPRFQPQNLEITTFITDTYKDYIDNDQVRLLVYLILDTYDPGTSLTLICEPQFLNLLVNQSLNGDFHAMKTLLSTSHNTHIIGTFDSSITKTLYDYWSHLPIEKHTIYTIHMGVTFTPTIPSKTVIEQLLSILQSSNDRLLVSPICESIMSLSPKVDLKPLLNVHHVSKLLPCLLQSKDLEHQFRISSILSLLSHFDTTINGNFANDILTCVSTLLKSENVLVFLNTVKCMISILSCSGIAHEKYLLQILKSFDSIYKGIQGKEHPRMLYFLALRNLIIFMLKYKDTFLSNAEIGNALLSLVKTYSMVDPLIDSELYIIDTKLEIIYLLTKHGIFGDHKETFDILLKLVRSSNSEISYKSIRTIGNLLVNFPQIYTSQLLDSLVVFTSHIHRLALSISLSELDNASLISTYLDQLLEQPDPIIRPDFRTDDIVAFLVLLGKSKSHIDTLLSVYKDLQVRVFANSDEKVYIYDAFISSLIYSYTNNSLSHGKDILEIMKHIYNDHKLPLYVRKKVSFHTRLLTMGHTLPELPPHEHTMSEFDPSELTPDMGTLASVYLRPVRSIFRHV